MLAQAGRKPGAASRMIFEYPKFCDCAVI